MKMLKFISVFFVISFIACKNQQKEEKSSVFSEGSSVKSTNSNPKTYAEISIKEGGIWDEGEYKNGTFKNVNSLKVPEEHTMHSWFIRYEGPGWESNKVAYRLYLDWRNAIDIFGKVTDSLVLSKIGQVGFDSYHEMNTWGLDILKVGDGLGIGSIGRYVKNEMLHFNEVDSTFASVENTKDKSTVTVDYHGWKTANDKIDLKSTLSISPDERYTKHTIQPSKPISGICTGIVNHGVAFFTKESENKKWAYIATYGEQTLVPDDLGMAIFYEVGTVSEVINAEFDYLIAFKPTDKPISFYFLGAWEQEKDGIKTEEEFKIYLDDKLNELNRTNTL